MGRIDRIAEPWGTRTPYGPGRRWPTRVDTYLADGLTEEDVDRWVQSASILHSNGDGLDIAVKDGRIVGVRGRAEDRVNHGRLGPKDLFGWQANHSPDRLTRPLVRRDGELVETDWDTAMDAVVGKVRGAARRAGRQRDRLLHDRPAVHRGVLHARPDRARRHRHEPRRRQHPAVHGHGRRGAEGVLRLRRAARLLHRRRPRRRHRALRAQHGRDADGAVDPDPRPAGRPEPADADLRRPAADPGGEGGHRAPRAAARHERDADERAAARDRAQRLVDRDYVDGARGGLRRAGEAAARSTRRRRGRGVRRPGRADPRGRPDHRHRRAAAVDRAAGLLPVAPGHGGRRAGEQHPHPARACSASPAAGSCR